MHELDLDFWALLALIILAAVLAVGMVFLITAP